MNALYFGSSVAPAKSSGNISTAQQLVHQHIFNSVQKLGGPGPLSGAEALEQLRAFDGYGEDQAPCAVKSYTPELLSLPDMGNCAVPLDELLGCDGRSIVGDFVHSRLLNVDEARSQLEKCGVRQPYSDPRLREPRVYREFVKRLLAAGLVELTTTEPVERVETFFVGKKDGRLRMVVDCRRSNCWFQPPDKVSLATAECLSRIELDKDSELYIATADLKDAFYHFSLPEQLRCYFGMRAVFAGDLNLTELNGRQLRPQMKLFPRLAVLPMGWSHALWWCQMIHQRIVLGAGAGRDTCLEDKAVVPNGELMHLEYVDNFVVLGTSEDKVSSLAAAGAAALRSKGLVVHEEEKGESSIKVLGWQFEKTEFKPVSSRVWRVRLAMKRLLELGAASGRQLEKVIGHATFIGLGRRESLSIFGETYTFIQRYYNCRHKFWKSVRRELQIFCGVCPLIWRDLSAPWSHEVLSIDASTWGLGATSADFPMSEVKQLGKFSERWRFDSDVYKNPRMSTFGADVAAASDQAAAHLWASNSAQAGGMEPIQVVPSKREQDKFEPIRLSVLHKSWKMVGRHRWKRSEPIPVLEARAALFGVKHVLRNRNNFGKRHLILSDSITAVCCLDRGRGRAFKMRRVSQQVGALCLATHTSFSYRWLPSEWNTADGPSRGSNFPSAIPYAGGHGDSQADSGGPGKVPEEAQSFEDMEQDFEATGTPGRQKGAETSSVGGSGNPEGSLDWRPVPEKVSGLLGKTEARDRCCIEQPNSCTHGGQNAGDDAGFNVFGRGGHFTGKLYDSSCEVSPPPAEVGEANMSAGIPTELERMEEVGPSEVAFASSMGGGLPDVKVHGRSQHGGRSADDAVVLCGLSSTWGAHKNKGSGFHPSSDNMSRKSEALVAGATSTGARRGIQDPGIRRDTDFRSAVQQCGGPSCVPHQTTASERGKPAGVRQGHPKAQSMHADSMREMWVGEPGRSTSLPPSAWRCQPRFHDKEERPVADTTPGEMEDPSFSEAVPKRGPLDTAPTQSASKSARRRNVRRKRPRAHAPIPALSPARALVVPVFLEIFFWMWQTRPCSGTRYRLASFVMGHLLGGTV